MHAAKSFMADSMPKQTTTTRKQVIILVIVAIATSCLMACSAALLWHYILVYQFTIQIDLKKAIGAVAHSRFSNRVALVNGDGHLNRSYISVWEITRTKGRKLLVKELPGYVTRESSLSHDGDTIAVVSLIGNNHIIEVFRLPSFSLLLSIQYKYSQDRFILHPDGSSVFLATGNPVAIYRYPLDREQRQRPAIIWKDDARMSKQITGLFLSGDGTLLGIVIDFREIAVLSLPSGQVIRRIKSKILIRSACFDNDGSHLLLASYKVCELYDFNRGRVTSLDVPYNFCAVLNSTGEAAVVVASECIYVCDFMEKSVVKLFEIDPSRYGPLQKLREFHTACFLDVSDMFAVFSETHVFVFDLMERKLIYEIPVAIR